MTCPSPLCSQALSSVTVALQLRLRTKRHDETQTLDNALEELGFAELEVSIVIGVPHFMVG